jgi:two-component system LytT family response regulator
MMQERMRVAIVVDHCRPRCGAREPRARNPDSEIVALAPTACDAVTAIADLEPELVFLDIQMPRLDGFEVAELIGAKTKLIFVTAYDQYALKAFECHALDYLLKPFSEQRFEQALAHARAQRNTPAALTAVQALAREAATRAAPLDRVLIRDGAKVHVIASARIDYIEAQDDYISIRSEGKSYLKSQRLSELETQLDPAKFLRVHRSYLLNIDGIARIEAATKDSHVAILRDDTRIPVSKAGYQKLKLLVG